MRVCLFEDSLAADLEPLTLTRPVFALLCGCTSLADNQDRYPDDRSLKVSLGYMPWTSWPPYDVRGGWAGLVPDELRGVSRARSGRAQ